MAIHAFTTSGLRRAVVGSAHLISETAFAVLGAGLFLLSALTFAQPKHLHRKSGLISHRVAAKPSASFLVVLSLARDVGEAI